MSTLSVPSDKSPIPRRKRSPVTLRRSVEIAASFVMVALLWLFAITVIFPMIWTLITSLKTSAELFQSPWDLPAVPQWDNYVRAWTKINVGTYMFNSIFVSASSLFFIMLLGSMIAYALARFDFKGNRVIYFYFISAMMIPGFLGFIPAWFLLRDIGLLGTHLGLIVMYVSGSLPFTVFFLQAFFKTLPRELEEAAIIDGASLFSVWWRIMMPLAQSGLLTIGVFNFLGVWNEYFWALVTIADDNLKTLPLGMANLYQVAHYATDWGALFAGFVIMLVPTFIVYAIFQSRLTSGITIGALKG